MEDIIERPFFSSLLYHGLSGLIISRDRVWFRFIYVQFKLNLCSSLFD